jgi:methionyl-tRNA formyltransferase
MTVRRLLILTMPGFGATATRHLLDLPACRELDVHVALVGTPPARWRRLAAWLRHHARAPGDRVHPLADATLSASPTERWLHQADVTWQWAADDNEVRALRQRLLPELTLTITSRVLFSARTLAEPGGTWLNVHAGLLPDYAGASPAPYMFMDGVGGCTIHEMVERIDAGAVIDLAPMEGDLGPTVGDYYFHRLPMHTARRVAGVIERWRIGTLTCESQTTGRPLHHRSSSRLASDRQLNWRWPAQRVERWVRSLAAIAPAWWVGPGGHRRVEVMEARSLSGAAPAAPGSVLRRQGRWIEVACADAAVVLRCRTTPAVNAGESLPNPPADA